MNKNSDEALKLEQEYRRVLRYLRKQKEAEENEEVDNNQIDCNQPE